MYLTFFVLGAYAGWMYGDTLYNKLKDWYYQ